MLLPTKIASKASTTVLYFNLFDKIANAPENESVTVLLVEQNAKQALKVSDYAYVLEVGTISLEGKGSDLLNNDSVRKIYLGEH